MTDDDQLELLLALLRLDVAAHREALKAAGLTTPTLPTLPASTRTQPRSSPRIEVEYLSATPTADRAVRKTILRIESFAHFP
jgi:hypothetical protein